MSERSDQMPELADLEERVDSLVREMNSATQRIEERFQHEDAPSSPQQGQGKTKKKAAGGGDESDGAATLVADALIAIEDLDGPAPGEPQEAPPEDAALTAAPDAGLEDDAEQLVRDASEAAQPPEPPEASQDAALPSSAQAATTDNPDPASPPHQPATNESASESGAPLETVAAVEEVEIEDLDDELAANADRLSEDDDLDDEVEGHFEAPHEVAEIASDDAEAATPQGASGESAADPTPATTDALEATEAPPPIVEVEAVEEAPAPRSADAATDAEPARRRRDLIVAPFLRAAHLLARPLDNLSPGTRDTIGWIALNTAFLAVCVWVYLLLR